MLSSARAGRTQGAAPKELIKGRVLSPRATLPVGKNGKTASNLAIAQNYLCAGLYILWRYQKASSLVSTNMSTSPPQVLSLDSKR